MPRRPILALALALTLATIAAATALARSSTLPSKELLAVRAAAAQYHSYGRALAAGYSGAGEPCVASPAGAMGVHAVNMALIQDFGVDPLRPEILLYAPRADGSLKLVGVEYWQIALANTGTGPAPWFAPDPPPLGFFNPAPSLFGQTFDGPMPGHNPQMPWHYDLHAWVIEHNPAGVFAISNPAVSC